MDPRDLHRLGGVLSGRLARDDARRGSDALARRTVSGRRAIRAPRARRPRDGRRARSRPGNRPELVALSLVGPWRNPAEGRASSRRRKPNVRRQVIEISSMPTKSFEGICEGPAREEGPPRNSRRVGFRAARRSPRREDHRLPREPADHLHARSSRKQVQDADAGLVRPTAASDHCTNRCSCAQSDIAPAKYAPLMSATISFVRS